MRWLAVVVMTCFAARSASADATVTLHGGPWTDFGWPAGAPSLSIAGVAIAGKASAKVTASKHLVKALVTIDGKAPYAFWIELRDGHRYMVDPDPCCFIVVADLDDGATPVRCAPADRCPAGLVEVDRWASHGHDCGNDKRACAAPALLRVRGDKTTVSWDEEAAVAADGAYHGAPVGRESPHRLTVRRNGAIVWDELVVVHHGERYTLDAAARDVQIVVDTPK